jgi:hypothetical protein
MLRYFIIAFVIAVSLFIPGRAKAASGPCSDPVYNVKPSMGTAKVQHKVRLLIGCAVDRWPVDGGLPKALAVADCESSFWPWANANGNYGVFQQRGAYWVDRVGSYLHRDWWTSTQWKRLHTVPAGPYLARANVILSIRMAHNGGWGPWSCA